MKASIVTKNHQYAFKSKIRTARTNFDYEKLASISCDTYNLLTSLVFLELVI